MRPIYKIFFSFSILITIAALIVTVVIWRKSHGDILGADFRGGVVLELEFAGSRPNNSDILHEFPDATVSAIGERGVIIRSSQMTDGQRESAEKVLSDRFGAVTEQRFNDVGPTVGQQLKSKSITAMILLLVTITVYLAIVFRTMRRVLSPWALGIAAIIALGAAWEIFKHRA